MCTKQCNDYSGVDKDDEIGDNHERRALDLATLHVGTAFFTARQIIAALQKDTRDNGERSRKTRESVRYRH